MVIFHCDHYGTLSQMIVLRYKFHKNDETILLISQNGSKMDIYQALEEKKIFDKVIPFNSGMGRSQGNKEEVNQVICDYFDNLFRETGVDLAAIDKVYISFDGANVFGIYAYNRRIAYSMVEFFPGQLADYSLYDRNEKAGYKVYAELLRETSALTGDEKLTKEYILVLPRPQDKDFSTHKRTVYVNFTKELSELPNDVKEKLLSVYHVSRGDFDVIDTLILTNSYGILSASGLPEKLLPYLYQPLLDYYVQSAGKIVIKRHPYGLIHFRNRMPDIAGNLNGNFPIEFIALFPDVKIKNVVVIMSTSIDKIRPYIDNVIEAGGEYLKNFQMLHQLYAAYSLLEAIGTPSINFHKTRGLNFLQTYLRYVFPQYGSKELKDTDLNVLKDNMFTVVDSCPPTEDADIRDGLQNAGKDAVTVFLNSNGCFDFYDAKRPELLDQMIPIKITKTALRDGILADLSDEYIYVFSKDAGVREKVKAFSLSKTLRYTGIELKAAPLEDSEIDLMKMEVRLVSMEATLKKTVYRLAELRNTAPFEAPAVDLTRMKTYLGDMEAALGEAADCLTES